jgi:hypothetical protein
LVVRATPHCESRVSQRTNVVQPGAAGVSQPWRTNATAPAFVGIVPAVSRDFTATFLQVRFPNSHGGLTPAALGRMCVGASQKSLFRRQTFAPQRKSGGRKPPVAPINANATATPHTPSAVCRQIGLVSADAHLPTHGGLTPAALGRMCVGASQKSLFHRQTFAPQRKSGGREPPVAPMHAIVIRSRMTHIRFWRYVSPVAPMPATATAIRTHTVGGLPTNRARVCGCAFAQPRRAHIRRSWSNVRWCIAKIVVSPADIRTATQERGA